MLTAPMLSTFHPFAHPLLQRVLVTVRRPFVQRMLIAVAVLSFIVLSAAVVVSAEDDLPTCPGDTVILAYPRYTNKGLIADHAYRCGNPSGGCTLREYTAKGPVYTCSPFVHSGRSGIL
jgi:hypothetical protein